MFFSLPTDINFYLVAIPAILIFGISKGGFGGVFGMISVPLMTLVMSPIQATGILLPILMLMDAFVIKKFWGQFDRAIAQRLIIAAIIGVIAGYFTAGWMNERALKLLVAVISLLFGIQTFIGFKAQSEKYDGLLARFWGCIAGFTSFHVHSGGPPLNAYLLPKKLPPKIYVGTVGMFFIFINWVKLPPYIMTGQLSRNVLLTSLVLAPLAPIGVAIGVYLMDKINPKRYYKWIGAGLILIGLRLSWAAFAA